MRLSGNAKYWSACLLCVAIWPKAANAHGNTHKDTDTSLSAPVPAEQTDWGIAGNAHDVSRTLEIRLSDDMRFSPDQLTVRKGETIRFVHQNVGQVMHEFVLGTQEELRAHAELMKRFPNMEHDAPYMAHIAPGKTGEIIWHFNKAGTFGFACLLPGHFEAGMHGTVNVLDTP